MAERTHINEWFEQLPTDVVAQAKYLLEQVDAMRQTEVIYPAQDNILNALAARNQCFASRTRHRASATSSTPPSPLLHRQAP